MSKKPITYKDSGVDIEAGEKLVESITGIVRETHSSAVLRDIGGFGGFFMPDFSAYEEPVLVSSVDGVGTKLIVAFRAGVYDTVGQDLVNHCVNDIAVCGADPLFFLDYFSTGKLEEQTGLEIVKGFATACKSNGVALVGGETAEMPDIYREGEFDLAGTVVGMVDRSRIISGNRIRKGDRLVGLRSSGLHTNGYSLARRVLFEEYEVDDHHSDLQSTVGEALLAVHRSYLTQIRILRELEEVHGLVHVTGGGIIGNTKRIVPERLSIGVDWEAWDRPPLFRLIQQTGDVPENDMRQTFNLGIGLIAVVAESAVDMVRRKLEEVDEEMIEIGEIGD